MSRISKQLGGDWGNSNGQEQALPVAERKIGLGIMAHMNRHALLVIKKEARSDVVEIGICRAVKFLA